MSTGKRGPMPSSMSVPSRTQLLGLLLPCSKAWEEPLWLGVRTGLAGRGVSSEQDTARSSAEQVVKGSCRWRAEGRGPERSPIPSPDGPACGPPGHHAEHRLPSQVCERLLQGEVSNL